MARFILQAEGLTKRYDTLTAVDHLSLDVLEGEIFGLLGPNGAGKTTLITMICGLLRPDEGYVLIGGQRIRHDDAATRRRVGMCPQDIVLWSNMTCIEQLQFIGEMYGIPGKVARQHGERLLKELGLEDKRNKQARTLSGGMQRRLNLAMALVHEPDIVLLDEPESGLDPQSRIAVRDYVKQLARRKTVILTTHNMDEADRLADRVAIIDHGRLLVLDTPDALKRSVGQGDVLEIGLKGNNDCRDMTLAALSEMAHKLEIHAEAHTLHIRALNIVNLLPEIIERLKTAQIPLGEVRLHENTLEDVFIQITGRRLRE